VFKQDIKEARHGVDATKKKLEKIMPSEELKIFDKDITKLLTACEEEGKKHVLNKEKEVKAV
jgi:hypothetical protein